jgi:hypothetical protein
LPSKVAAGDGLLALFTVDNAKAKVTAPTGWRKVASQSNSGALSIIWQKVAAGGDAGRTVKVGLTAAAKTDLRVFAYSNTNASTPVAAATGAAERSAVKKHTTPPASVSAASRWAVSYWAVKVSGTTTWTLAKGMTSRGSSSGSGSGRLSTLVADSGGTVPAGTYGRKAAATSTSAAALMWTVILAPVSS